VIRPTLTRVPLAFSMLIVVVVALGLSAMRLATPLVLKATFTLTLCALLMGTLAAMVRQSDGFWPGFALFGWSYAVVFFVPGVFAAVAPRLLVTVTWPVEELVDRMHTVGGLLGPPIGFASRAQDGTLFVSDDKGLTARPATNAEEIEQKAWEILEAKRTAQSSRHELAVVIANLIQGLLFALCGAVLGRILADRRLPYAADPGL